MTAQPFDLTGHATVYLAIATFILAGITTWSVVAQKKAVKRGFEFERVRQVPAFAPLLTVKIGKTSSNPLLNANSWYLQFSNSGTGPACNVRFSGLYNGALITAAMYVVPAIGPGKDYASPIEINNDGINPFHFNELLIRYEDVFGNLYATEYTRFDDRGGSYIWRRPWVGADFDVPQPEYDSADPPEWGETGREYWDAIKQKR